MRSFLQKSSSICTSSLIAFIILLFSQPASIASDDFGDGPDDSFGFVFKKAWQEAELPLPDMPTDARLLPLKVFQMPAYKYYIDIESINVSAGDNVARYTIVIEPPSGLRNVFFEGIRCDKNKYKLYGSALWGKPLTKISTSNWQGIIERGVGVYRHDLFKYFLCNKSIINGEKKDIVQLLKYPPSNFIDEEEE